MAWRCFALAVVAVVFSGCFLSVHSFVHNVAVVTEPQPGTDAVCDTSVCTSIAVKMMEKMNRSADPCEDFNEFACGRFIDEYVLPEGKIDVKPFDIIESNINAMLHDLIVNNTDPTRPQYVRNIQRLFNSCMNETQIEVVGLAPYFNDHTFVGDWPTLNSNWIESSFDLNEVIARYIKVDVSPIFGVTVYINQTDASKHVIQLNQPHLTLGREFFKKPRNDSLTLAYERYLAETAIALNASRDVAERDARGVVDLEIALTRIMVPPEQQRDVTKQMNPVKLIKFSELYPSLDIALAVRSLFSTVNITLANDEIVVNLFPRYIKDIESVLECFPKRTIQNLFGFKYAVLRVAGITRRIRNITMDLVRVLAGNVKERPRWQTCVQSASYIFSQGISKLFVGSVFSETAKRNVNTMIDELKNEFRKMIEEATWMSNLTKSEAFVKLAAMKRKVGYPDAGFEEADLERIYENYTMSEDNYYNNLVLADDLLRLKNLATLRKSVDPNKWRYPPHDVNAYSSWTRNEIGILAGIMQAPYYSETFPDYLNYGAIGYIIGHEITHLFDDIGMKYDANGNVRNWWTTEDLENFVNRSKCIVDQYSDFSLDEINMHLNGLITQGEAQGDTGGLKESFRAYKQHVLIHGQQSRLPALNLTQDQLFFLSFAQLYCHKLTIQRLEFYVNSEHPPGKYRILGALQNSQDFARVYNCPQGSYMNPPKKCGVW